MADTAKHALSPGWVWTTIGEITEVVRGASPRPKGNPKYFGGTIPWVMISDVTRVGGKLLSATRETVTAEGAAKSRLVKAGTLILSNSGTVCVPKILAVDACIHDGFVAFPGLSQVDLTYLYHYFDFIRPRIIQANRQGITQVNLNTAIVRAIELPLAPLAEQRRIVAKIEELFTELDAGLAALKRAQVTLHRYKASVLKAACEGRLVPQDPADEPAGVLLQRILAERRAKWEADLRAKGKDPAKAKYVEPASLEACDLPELPKGWVWATVEQVSAFIVDCLHSTPKFLDAGYFCLDSNWIKPGQLITSKARYVNKETFIERNRRMKPEMGDVVFSREGALLGVAVNLPANFECCLGQRMMIFRFDGVVQSKYFETVLNSQLFRSQYQPLIGGTASPHINISDIRRFVVPLPPLAEQQRIVAEVEQRLSISAAAETTLKASLVRAERLRQAILRRAFSGQLVPQDPNDESASALLERIGSVREPQLSLIAKSQSSTKQGKAKI